MNVAIVAGSHRPQSESERVARYAEQVLQRLGADRTFLLSLADNPLPLWDEGAWKPDATWDRLWSPIARELTDAEALVIVSPEWSGMVPPGLKNFFLLCGGELLAHKPALIVSVSASLGGAYPVAELRTSSYKNTRICYLPDHVIVRHVGRMLHGESPADEHDAALRKRLEYALRMLLEYGRALRHVRSSGVVDLKSFPYGM